MGDPFVVSIYDYPHRRRLLQALAMMPDEAFSWLVLAVEDQAVLQGSTFQIWPDAIGGFTPDSRPAITEARAAARELIEWARG